MRIGRLRLLCVLAVMLALSAGWVSAQDGDGEDNEMSQFEGNPELAIPEFPEGLEWVNVDAPLSIEDLRGKIVIFDFWTYGCINCIHMIPILEQLQEEYADTLVVIGVHSAKFENEGQTENIRQIVQRYKVTHPVINDSDFTVWRMYGARAWPTFVVVDPRGNVLAAQAGEIPFDAFDQLIGAMVDHWDGLGELDRSPLALDPEGSGDPARLLDFPGKVLVDAEGGRLFIADTGHHRIVIADLETYEILDVIGSGQRGYDSGDFDTSTFNQPYGMALKDGVLYIADSKNHAVRTADLESRTVDVLAGTGEIGQGAPLAFGVRISEPRAFQLRSPWDVEFGAGDTLFIANAGSHQIFEMNVATGVLRPSVGNGREANLNSTLATSELAQPSGLYFNDGLLYFADSESSTIRVADYENDTVTGVSGTLENSLFDFGDVDGAVGTSRLQHALGVDGTGDGLLYIADTYNSRIKVIDPAMSTETLFGLGGTGGFADGDAATAEFDEPGGLDYHDGKLYIADTNNHSIRIIDLDAGTVSTINFPNPERLQIAERVTVIGGSMIETDTFTLEPQTVAAGDGSVTLRLTMPEGYKLNDIAPSVIRLIGEDAATIAEADQSQTIENLELSIPVTFADGEGRITGDVEIYFCEAVNDTLCFIDEFRVDIPVTVSDDGTDTITIERELVPPVIENMGF